MLRAVISVGMNLTGMLIVFVAVLAPQISANLQLQIILVLIGVLLVQAAVWKFTNPFLPSERRYDDLRNEVDEFIDLVRELNAAAVQARKSRAVEATDRVDQVLHRMHLSVDQMGRLAGKEMTFAYLPEPLEEVTEGSGASAVEAGADLASSHERRPEPTPTG